MQRRPPDLHMLHSLAASKMASAQMRDAQTRFNSCLLLQQKTGTAFSPHVWRQHLPMVSERPALSLLLCTASWLCRCRTCIAVRAPACCRTSVQGVPTAAVNQAAAASAPAGSSLAPPPPPPAGGCAACSADTACGPAS